LANPQKKFKTIHVLAQTVKGSHKPHACCSFTKLPVMQLPIYLTHLKDFRERIKGERGKYVKRISFVGLC